MAVPGLSLFGFLEEDEALQYLDAACVLEGAADPLACHAEARGRLGKPLGARVPDIATIPPGFETHLQELEAKSWFQRVASTDPWQFAMVEIEPLLAFQFSVTLPRSEELCSQLIAGDITSLVGLCLPLDAHPIPIKTSVSASQDGTGTMVVKSPNLNLAFWGAGDFGKAQDSLFNVIGAAVGPAVPILQVGKFRDRYYLRNGFHRAYGAAKLGFSHVPCVLIDFDDFNTLTGGGQTFSQDLLESDNPPTLGHFVQDRAYELSLVEVTRIITVSWSTHAIPED